MDPVQGIVQEGVLTLTTATGIFQILQQHKWSSKF